jgi:hypothetical protein
MTLHRLVEFAAFLLASAGLVVLVRLFITWIERSRS